jgi:hypothetical protein
MPATSSEREENYLLQHNRATIIGGIFGYQTLEQVESGICFARYVCSVGITRSNYRVFLKLLETNNKWIIDALIGRREAALVFSTIKPNKFLIRKAFTILSFWHPAQIYEKLIQAVMGILQYAYHKADDGYRIYKLRITDLNNVGKFLDKSKSQDDPKNRVILDALDKICHIGEYENSLEKSLISKQAFSIRFAYFDNTKRLVDTIPGVLLVKLEREIDEKKPSPHFIRFLASDLKGTSKNLF